MFLNYCPIRIDELSARSHTAARSVRIAIRRGLTEIQDGSKQKWRRAVSTVESHACRSFAELEVLTTDLTGDHS